MIRVLTLWLALTSIAWGAGIAELSSQRTTKNIAGANSTTQAYPNNVTSGNLLTVQGCAFDGTADPASITVTGSGAGCAGTTFTVHSNAAFDSNGNYRLFIARGIAAATGACTVTVDPAGTSSDMGFAIDEFSGVDSANPLDVDAGTANSGGSTGTAVSQSVTTASDNALILGATAYSGADTTITQGGSYTLIGESETGSGSQPFSAVFRIAGTAQAYTVDWTLGAARFWDSYVVSIRAAASTTTPGISLGIMAARKRRDIIAAAGAPPTRHRVIISGR